MNIDKGILVYILVFCILCLNYMVDRYYEVYPSVVFPAFSSAPIMKSNAEFKISEIYAVTQGDKELLLDESRIFLNLYTKHSNFILMTLVKRINSGKISQSDGYLREYFLKNLDAQTRRNTKKVKIVLSTVNYSLTERRMLSTKENLSVIYFDLNNKQ